MGGRKAFLPAALQLKNAGIIIAFHQEAKGSVSAVPLFLTAQLLPFTPLDNGSIRRSLLIYFSARSSRRSSWSLPCRLAPTGGSLVGLVPVLVPVITSINYSFHNSIANKQAAVKTNICKFVRNSSSRRHVI